MKGTNTPVRITWYNDRIEIQSPGGPFGSVTAQNFGQDGITDYRNPNLADAMKVLGFVQRFGSRNRDGETNASGRRTSGTRVPRRSRFRDGDRAGASIMSIPVLTFFNNKGGVGKTSLAYHLAWMLPKIGHKVLVCDLDPQANLTAAFLDEGSSGSPVERPGKHRSRRDDF